ncbi:DUF2007 domain-containing protein [Fontisphaera persica]|uniref:DUF2007 domain-containing protein n=1 Tax=Fontisphaera persica TaxID=2974023 RepID=UPI0024BFE988|nr:DUF2007 domain-containing protein [Fontisphaera persica]WCJ60437.1 DUF2007 domain-containing protein [Fontisphaera persica]
MESNPVVIFKTLSLPQAQLVCSRLQAAGFFASVSHELAALSMEGYSLATGGVRVEVPADQAEEARAFLESSIEIPPAAGPASDSPR